VEFVQSVIVTLAFGSFDDEDESLPPQAAVDRSRPAAATASAARPARVGVKDIKHLVEYGSACEGRHNVGKPLNRSAVMSIVIDNDFVSGVTTARIR